jgi:Alpha-tubulin suppressor and related RCC1 domain-containing proteins
VWGESKFGQLGLGKENVSYVLEPTKLPNEEKHNILDVYAGFRQTYLLCGQNKILCTGSNKFLEFGQTTKEGTMFSPVTLEFPKINGQIKKLAIGQKHVIALNHNGEIYGWGSNKFGQLGIENKDKETNYEYRKLEVSDVKEISCGWNHSLLLLSKNP